METIKILEEADKRMDWEYDAEADVLYISLGKPRPAESIDIGEGTIVRLDPKNKGLVGITLLGVSSRVIRWLEDKKDNTASPAQSRLAVPSR